MRRGNAFGRVCLCVSVCTIRALAIEDPGLETSVCSKLVCTDYETLHWTAEFCCCFLRILTFNKYFQYTLTNHLLSPIIYYSSTFLHYANNTV